MSTRQITHGYIYSITNKRTGKTYIGSTNRILRSRWLEHKKRLRQGTHVNKALQADYDDTGLRNFKFKLLEKCSPEETDQREQYYLELYKKESAGVYNTGEEAGLVFKGRAHSEETKRKIAATLTKTLEERKKREQGRR